VIVTHDLELSRRAHRIIHLAAGRVDRIEVLSGAPESANA
jgi:predicted ABC-type transport system involved in lysophospholipase L1 biosynthesis ATPase subunit